MKVKVIRRFTDKYTGAIYNKGDLIEITEERYEEILSVGEFVFKVAQDNAQNASDENMNTLSNEAEETPTDDSGASGDGFDIMSMRELREYADKVHKLTFGRGVKKAEIIAELRRMEHGK